MATHRGEQHVPDHRGIGDTQPTDARGGTAGAVAELRRLIQTPSFQSVERVLAGLGSDPSGPITGIDAVRALRRWGVEYLRVADELEAAARCCRLAEREIGERIDAFLVDWAEPPAVEHAREPGTPASARRGGLEGWLRELLHRGRTGQERPAGAPVPARGTPPIPPKATLPSRPAGPASPRAAPTVPAADIAALVLGPLELSVAGRRVLRWNSQKAKAVLQYLLIHADRPVRRDVLMQLQWPDHTRSSARNNLNVALYSLRNTLDGPGQDVQPIVYQDGCYSLNPELTWSIDRNEFLSALHRAKSADRADRPQQAIDAYENAVRLYRGPLFEDDPVGDWFLPEQRHLEEQYLQALEHLATVYFELGQLAEAVRFGQLAVGTDPCCEPVHRLLMRCFDSQQQRQLVSRQYRSCVAALRDELGVPPGEETVQLFRSLTAAM